MIILSGAVSQKGDILSRFSSAWLCSVEPTILTDQKIVGNSLQPIDVIITGKPIHQSFTLRVSNDAIGQYG